MSIVGQLVTRLLLGMIRVYQRFVSPMIGYWFGPCCRFHPSCSCYASDALQIHGVLRGSGLAVWRILRCHPFNPGGLDPVPQASAALASSPSEANAMPEESARP